MPEIRSRCHHTVTPPGHPPVQLAAILLEHGVSYAEVSTLDCPAVHEMAALLGRSNYLARTESRLLLAEFPPLSPPTPRFEPRSARVAVTLMALTALATLIICTGIWRFLT